MFHDKVNISNISTKVPNAVLTGFWTGESFFTHWSADLPSRLISWPVLATRPLRLVRRALYEQSGLYCRLKSSKEQADHPGTLPFSMCAAPHQDSFMDCVIAQMLLVAVKECALQVK